MHWLYNSAKSNFVFPTPPSDTMLPFNQWNNQCRNTSKQEAIDDNKKNDYDYYGILISCCGICLKPIDIYDSIQWDLYPKLNYWIWMHSHCNTNPWNYDREQHIPSLHALTFHRQMYHARHYSNQTFNHLLLLLLSTKSTNHKSLIKYKKIIQQQLEIRISHLMEQAILQIRYQEHLQLNLKNLLSIHLILDPINATKSIEETTPKPKLKIQNTNPSKKRKYPSFFRKQKKHIQN